MKQNSNLIHENGKLNKQLARRKAESEQLIGDIHSYELVKAELERTVGKRDEEVTELKKKIFELEKQCDGAKKTPDIDKDRELEKERVAQQKAIA